MTMWRCGLSKTYQARHGQSVPTRERDNQKQIVAQRGVLLCATRVLGPCVADYFLLVASQWPGQECQNTKRAFVGGIKTAGLAVCAFGPVPWQGKVVSRMSPASRLAGAFKLW